MAFDSLSEFFAMGGHGVYIWAAWGATGLLLVVLAVHARLEQRKVMQALRRKLRREQQQAARGTVSPDASPDVISDRGHAHERQT
ncbi:MAG: heme exporter protein CcmD [Halomonas sp.]|uniref:heme exporter protein CcmD n=1 Tax=Halomonas sp. TaxID=1486246 RepID=UPI003F925528